jgi:16S rRNA (adenine1518-N6/adenine1519-N6)-dimethyltransferase
MPPQAFWPRPLVTSAIVHIQLAVEKRSRIADLRYFHDFCRSLFFHRRKFLRSAMTSAFKSQLDKSQIDAVLAQRKYGPDVRAEQLPVEEIIELADAVRARSQAPR